MPTQFWSESTCPEWATEAAETLIVGPNRIPGQIPGTPGTGTPGSLEGRIECEDAAVPTHQPVPGCGTPWAAGPAVAVAAGATSAAARDTRPAAMTARTLHPGAPPHSVDLSVPPMSQPQSGWNARDGSPVDPGVPEVTGISAS